jgi:hypothetical protein
MEAPKGVAVAGEGKAVTNFPLCSEEASKAAAALDALIRQPEKTVAGEWKGATPGASEYGAQGRACRRWARLGIGSLGTISFLSFFSRHPARAKIAVDARCDNPN